MRRRKRHSGELFTRDGRAIRDAELHAELLDNPEADQTIAHEAVERAIGRGIDQELAHELYSRGREALTVEHGRTPTTS